MIQLQKVSKEFSPGTRAVEEVSFHVEEGETFGLIGTSGCGKTTTLKMINRLIDPTSGTISIKGTNVTSRDPRKLRRQIGYVIQDVGLFPHYSVEENIATVPRLLKWDEKRIKSRSDELLQLVGLAPANFADRKPGALSGGQQQRVGLARALAADPPIILMDEPFGALDPITKRQIRSEVTDIFSRLEKTIVLVTHDIQEAFEMCDRLCLLNAGKVQQIGRPVDLLFSPANDFVDSFFSSNRFQLELLSTKLMDILDPINEKTELYLSPPLKTGDGNSTEVDKRDSLYAVLEKLEKAPDENAVLIRREDNQVTESLDFTDLLGRFRKFKRESSRGRRND